MGGGLEICVGSPGGRERVWLSGQVEQRGMEAWCQNTEVDGKRMA